MFVSESGRWRQRLWRRPRALRRSGRRLRPRSQRSCLLHAQRWPRGRARTEQRSGPAHRHAPAVDKAAQFVSNFRLGCLQHACTVPASFLGKACCFDQTCVYGLGTYCCAFACCRQHSGLPQRNQRAHIWRECKLCSLKRYQFFWHGRASQMIALPCLSDSSLLMCRRMRPPTRQPF